MPIKMSFKNLKHTTVVVVCFLLSFVFAKVHAQKQQYDVIVYGATSAGVVAAYTAKLSGKSVVIVEPGIHLGGMTSGGLGYTDIGNKYAISGVSRDFYRKIGQHYGKFEQWTFEPHIAKMYLQQYLDKSQIKVLYQHQLLKANVKGKTIQSILLKNVQQNGNKVELGAKVFIDCTYEGDLLAKSGVSYHVGREANSEFNETINGVQLMNGHQFPDGIDPYKIAGNSNSGLLWGISDAKLDPNGTGDSKVQAYNYRICLTSDPSNRIPITKPEGYNSDQFELLARLIAKQPEKKRLLDYFIWSKMPNNKTDINNRNGFSTDMIGMNHKYPEASFEERENIVKAHEVYTKGLLYFFGHDERVPVEIRKEMSEWGYPKDEYVDTNNWTPQLYVRETRRMMGQYVMTQANCQGKEVVKDGIGMAAYTMDSHNCQRIVVNGMVKNEGNVEVGGFGPYPISYGSIVPKKTECTNLIVPVCLSATHIAYGSIRMEPVFMVLAQSAGAAAVMAIDTKKPVQEINVTKLQELLKANPLADGSVPEILVDNNDTHQVAMKGNWKSEKRGGYGPDFLTSSQKENSGASVTYAPNITSSGKYGVYLYVPKIKELAVETNLEVVNGTTVKQLVVKDSDIMVEGQTSGEWYHVGDYTIDKNSGFKLNVLASSGEGTVVADAALFVPLGK